MAGGAADIHAPVLADEVLEYLSPAPGSIIVDCNLGMGGHSQRILEANAPDGRVIGFDWDKEAISLAKERLSAFGERLVCVADNFAAMPHRLREMGITEIDGLLLDLGLSSFQLDVSGRGFSFRDDQPLDMRMDARGGTTAAELVNRASEEDLADIFYHYGEERQARRIARFIVEARRKTRFETTSQLVGIVEKAVPARFRPKKIHVATKVFQALRIAVNRELDNLDEILCHGPQMLKNGAKMCVISFHSLEDRLVKRAFANSDSLRILTRKPVMAGENELAANPRARSARLRAAQKVEEA